MDFSHNGRTEKVRVYSLPEISSICKVEFREVYNTNVGPWTSFVPKKYQRTIVFSKFSVNMQAKGFNEKLINECRKECMKFIATHNGYELDTKLLDERVKNLLLFI